VAWEALARGPQESPLHLPGALFAAAGAAGRTAELDLACRVAALRGALDAVVQDSGGTLFVNVEPGSAGQAPSPALEAVRAEAAARGLEVVVEVTERDLTARPADLLRVLDRVRELGWRVALDDVGAERRSLALMPIIRPDVIKFDMRMVQAPLDRAAARTVNAVAAEAERSGALLLAEGIETAEHLEAALTLGARLGQGWFFGRPAALPAQLPAAEWRALEVAPATDWHGATPFRILSSARPLMRGTKRRLLELSLQLEAEAAGDDAVVLLATFQHRAFFTARTRARYERMSATAAFVGALAVGLGSEPARGVRGVALGAAEPLAGEWDVVVLAPHFAGAFSARDLGDRGPDFERRFDYATTYDRSLVVRAAESLMRRTAAAAG
jgi:EAL domain-containing protein (putative c-di-GMP-specific phosphodiesterase class I)